MLNTHVSTSDISVHNCYLVNTTREGDILEKVEQVMDKYKLFKKKVMQMNNKTLQLALIIIDNAEGVTHEDFFEIAELLFLVDKMNIHILAED